DEKVAACFGRRLAQAIGHVAYQVAKAETLDRQLETLGGDARYVQQRIDEVREALAAPGGPLDSLRHRSIERLDLRLHAFELKLQRRERRLELVGGNRQELV